MLHNLRYALRVLLKTPGFTTIAVVTLALGIGANTAIFSVINAVLLRSLPYRDPARLMIVAHADDGAMRGSYVTANLFGVSPPNYSDFRDQNRSFEQLAAYTPADFVLTGGKQPERIPAALVSANLMPMLGIQPALGRWFVTGEDEPGHQMAIISYGLWQREFGGSSGVLGKALTLDGHPYTIIGVMPRAFAFPADAPETELWLPLAFSSEMRVRGAHYLNVLGRLKPHVTIEAAEVDLESIGRGLRQHYPGLVPTNVTAVPLRTVLVGDVRGSLLLLTGAVSLVLLIAVANVAGLLLARAGSRQREVAIRVAVGATRRHLAQQFLAESILLAIAGGVAGLLLASWGTDLLIAISPADLPHVHQIGIDGWVLLFTAAVSIVTGIAFGLASAFRSAAPDLNAGLKQGMASTVARQRVRRLLVGGEVVLAFVLLCAGGLMVRTLMKLAAVDPGFDPESVLTAEISLPQAYAEPVRQAEFADELLRRLEGMPGVKSVGFTSALPLGGTHMTFRAKLPAQPNQQVAVGFRSVSPGYLPSMRIPIRAGREFTVADGSSSRNVGIINETLARRFWPGESAIGRTITSGFVRGPIEIVGVSGNVESSALDAAVEPELYIPFDKRPFPFVRIIVRGQGDPLQLAPMLREQVRALDQDLPVDKIRTMKSVMAGTVARRRFFMLLLTIFAALALGLAAVGIYGVVSYEVAQRTREIGIRMALGATRYSVLSMVVLQALVPTVAGLAIGGAMAIVATQLLRSLLYGISPTDPFTYVASAMVLAGAAAIAALAPARRATKVDPMIALRYE